MMTIPLRTSGKKSSSQVRYFLFPLLLILLASTNADAEGGKIHLSYPTVTGSLPIRTWKDLRDHQVEKQDRDFSCGAAAVATILRYFYGQEISEKDILDEIGRIGSAAERLRPYIKAVGDQLGIEKLTPAEQGALEKVVQENAGPASFQDLGEAARRFGFKAVGLRLGFEQLKAIRIPAIAHLNYHGQGHFSVIRGIRNDGLVWLGDPALGNRKLSESQFKAMWGANSDHQGQILFLLPEGEYPIEINDDFFKPPKTNATAIQRLTSSSIRSLGIDTFLSTRIPRYIF